MLDATLRSRWTPEHELVEDLAVVSKLTLARGPQIFFLSGCYSFGTFVAAQCFLHRELGVRNAQYIRNYAGDDDFTIVTETRRFGGDFTDVPDFSAVDPLLLMSRGNAKSPYTVLVDNRQRYVSDGPPAQRVLPRRAGNTARGASTISPTVPPRSAAIGRITAPKI